MLWHYGWGFGFPWFGLFFLFFFLFWLIPGRRHWHRHGAYRWNGEKSAEEVLADRYARGEISKEEYEERITVLKKHSK